MKIDDVDFETDLEMGSPLDAELLQTALRYEDGVKDLRSRMEFLIRRLQDGLVACDHALSGHAFGMDSSGLIRGTGRDIDRDCATVAIRGDHLRTLLRLRKEIAKGSACRC